MCTEVHLILLNTARSPSFTHPHRAHKRRQDVDVRHRAQRCNHVSGCMRQGLFASPQTPHTRFCAEHRTDGMVDVHSKRCDEPGCLLRAQYMDAHTGGRMMGRGRQARGHRQAAKFCRLHRPAVYVDIHHRTCASPEGCTTIASFGSKHDGQPRYGLRFQTLYAKLEPTNFAQGGWRWLAGWGVKRESGRAHRSCSAALSPRHQASRFSWE